MTSPERIEARRACASPEALYRIPGGQLPRRRLPLSSIGKVSSTRHGADPGYTKPGAARLASTWNAPIGAEQAGAPRESETRWRARHASWKCCARTVARCLVAVRADAVNTTKARTPASAHGARDVTEERRQRALARAERKYREPVRAPVVGSTHPDGTLLEAQSGHRPPARYDTPAELLGAGRRVSDLYAHPEERDPLLLRIRESGRP